MKRGCGWIEWQIGRWTSWSDGGKLHRRLKLAHPQAALHGAPLFTSLRLFVT